MSTLLFSFAEVDQQDFLVNAMKHFLTQQVDVAGLAENSPAGVIRNGNSQYCTEKQRGVLQRKAGKL